jgi:transposase
MSSKAGASGPIVRPNMVPAQLSITFSRAGQSVASGKTCAANLPAMAVQMIDSTHIKAHRSAAGKGGAEAGCWPFARRAQHEDPRTCRCERASPRHPADRREAHHCPIAGRLIRRVKRAKRMLGDKAYDSTELREDLDDQGTKPMIPNRSNRKQPFTFSKRLYRLRWRIESVFNRLKDFRRIATRYDKLARNCLASVCSGPARRPSKFFLDAVSMN